MSLQVHPDFHVGLPPLKGGTPYRILAVALDVSWHFGKLAIRSGFGKSQPILRLAWICWDFMIRIDPKIYHLAYLTILNL